MAYKYVNPNPLANHTGDCTVRAASIATGEPWDCVYDDMAELGRQMGRGTTKYKHTSLCSSSQELLPKHISKKHERPSY